MTCWWGMLLAVPNLAQLVSRDRTFTAVLPSQAPSLPPRLTIFGLPKRAYEAGIDSNLVTEQVDALRMRYRSIQRGLMQLIRPTLWLARFNESSPPKQESVRSRSHSALTTARGKTAEFESPGSSFQYHPCRAECAPVRWRWLWLAAAAAAST